MTIAAVVPAPAGQAGTDAAAVTVEVLSDLGSADDALAGLGWNTGDLDHLGDLTPPTVRIDASIQSASRGPGELDTTLLEQKIQTVIGRGSEPLVILSYVPAWLGEPRAYGRNPEVVAPYDYDLWELLVEDVVRAAASAGAQRFEVWNEPDVPVFWQDTPAAFLRLAERTHRAVASVDAELSEVDLMIGGPAAVTMDAPFIAAYVTAIQDADLPLDFVSWHHYASTPFIGPDGNEGFIPEPLYDTAGRHRNPVVSPTVYGDQIAFAHASLDPLLPTGTPFLMTEWNLSAAGFDRRHDTHEGAAFALGSLIEMERAGLDGSDHYKAIEHPGEERGDWGIADELGVDPAWHVFDAWLKSAGSTRLAVTGDSPRSGLWARATRRLDVVTVLLATFAADGRSGRDVQLSLDGCIPSGSRLATIDAEHSEPTFADAEVTDGRIDLTVADQSVTILEVQCSTPVVATAP